MAPPKGFTPWNKGNRRPPPPPLTAALLRKLLEYDPDTGLFTWLISHGDVEAGDIAGAMTGKGYIRFGVNERKYIAHRLAWLYATGAWPANQIDHANGVRHDNRLCNLREATPSENMQNRHRQKAGKHGSLGAHYYKPRGNWVAKIRVDGKDRHLGYFPNEDQAHAAYLDAKRQFHPFAKLSKGAA